MGLPHFWHLNGLDSLISHFAYSIMVISNLNRFVLCIYKKRRKLWTDMDHNYQLYPNSTNSTHAADASSSSSSKPNQAAARAAAGCQAQPPSASSSTAESF